MKTKQTEHKRCVSGAPGAPGSSGSSGAPGASASAPAPAPAHPSAASATNAAHLVRSAATCGMPRGVGSKHPLQGTTMTGACAVVASLEAEGVRVLFGYPGGQVIRIYDALYDSTQIQHVLVCHEQAAVHAADGYARATGDVGVVLATSGPGATNTVTGIATAYMDSVPLVVITGQVPRHLIGTDAFQESDIVGITMPIVKHSYLLQSAEEIAPTIREAFHIAKTGRPGPVLVDIPSDITTQLVRFAYPDTVNIPSYRPTYKGNAKQIRMAHTRICEASAPVLYVGGGAISSGCSQQLLQLIRQTNIPAVTTLMAKGILPTDEPLNFGFVGMHGSRYANYALNNADLIIACGTRFSDRVTGKLETFAPHADVIHIDIDPAEIGKNREATIPVVGDLALVLNALNDMFAKHTLRPDTQEWLAQLAALRQEYPLYKPEYDTETSAIVPQRAMKLLSRFINESADDIVVTTEVGQHQMWAAQYLDVNKPRHFLTSGGAGTMGFGFPAAIGAAVGLCVEHQQQHTQVVCVAGDGSIQMNSQEMATAALAHVPVKLVIFDNRALGMVRQWQQLFYHERYMCTELQENPHFVALAHAYNWKAEQVNSWDELAGAYQRMLASKEPYLLDVRIARDELVSPMVAPGSSLDNSKDVSKQPQCEKEDVR